MTCLLPHGLLWLGRRPIRGGEALAPIHVHEHHEYGEQNQGVVPATDHPCMHVFFYSKQMRGGGLYFVPRSRFTRIAVCLCRLSGCMPQLGFCGVNEMFFLEEE